jgi:hypothetical protein
MEGGCGGVVGQGGQADLVIVPRGFGGRLRIRSDLPNLVKSTGNLSKLAANVQILTYF